MDFASEVTNEPTSTRPLTVAPPPMRVVIVGDVSAWMIPTTTPAPKETAIARPSADDIVVISDLTVTLVPALSVPSSLVVKEPLASTPTRAKPMPTASPPAKDVPSPTATW